MVNTYWPGDYGEKGRGFINQLMSKTRNMAKSARHMEFAVSLNELGEMLQVPYSRKLIYEYLIRVCQKNVPDKEMKIRLLEIRLRKIMREALI